MSLTWIVVIIIVLVFIWVISVYNRLVRKRIRRVEISWSQIDVQLQRRTDLIPNLVAAVKGYMGFEQKTLEKVMEARAKATGANSKKSRMEAEGEVTTSLGRLLAVVENYPELKADEHTMKLIDELSNTENLIAETREAYNDAVMVYNTAIKVFPSSLIAAIFRFKSFDLFTLPEQEKESPIKVDLSF